MILKNTPFQNGLDFPLISTTPHSCK